VKGSERRAGAFPRGRHPMELVVRKTDLFRELQLFLGIVERKNTFVTSCIE
jgi:hypothetical protein